jgi:hypothetical protein
MANNSINHEKIDHEKRLGFQCIQHDFAGHIKDPKNTVKPADVDERHMAVYRDLFFKNIMSFLDGAFPVLAEIIGTTRWQEIGREFFIQHENKSPYFLEISQEFLKFLESEFEPQAHDPEYMYELAHYEWLELFVAVEPEARIKWKVEAQVDSAPELSASEKHVEHSVLILSPVVEGFLYSYPVHQISAAQPEVTAKPTALIVYRGRDEDVHFVETNPFTLQLLALLKEGMESEVQQPTGGEVLQSLLAKMNMNDNQAAYQGGLDTLKQWLSLGVIWRCI